MSDDQWVINELRERIEFYYSDLVFFIEWLAENRYQWRGGRLPVPDDIAQAIIFKVLHGDRKGFDPNKGTLRKWLRLQARSVVDALAKSASHRHDSDLPEDELFSIDYGRNPEDQIVEGELEEERQAKISQEVNALFQVNIPALREVVEAIVNGCEPKPRFLAEALGTDRDDIYNRLKRLRRLVKKGEVDNE